MNDDRCRTCGEPLKPGASKCERCGTPVSAASPAAHSHADASGGEAQCPSCKHVNESSARFCERCGTQLRDAAAAGAGARNVPAQQSAPSYQSEDPWATGPGYDRPLRPDEMCPRCGSHRNPTDSVCTSCGLPFGQQANYAGIPPAVAEKGTPAGVLFRFIAAIVDGFIVGLGSLLITWIYATATSTSGEFANSYQTVQFVFGLLYAPLFLASRGTTPGKTLFNIYVFDDEGQKPNLLRAFVRELSKYVSALALMIGYIMAAFRQDRRALHDLIAGTYPTEVRPVVRSDQYQQ